MAAYDIAEANANPSRLVEQAEAGETIGIMRRGRPVARLTPIEQPQPQIDIEALRRLTDSLPFQEVDPVALIRQMRDEGY